MSMKDSKNVGQEEPRRVGIVEIRVPEKSSPTVYMRTIVQSFRFITADAVGTIRMPQTY